MLQKLAVGNVICRAEMMHARRWAEAYGFVVARGMWRDAAHDNILETHRACTPLCGGQRAFRLAANSALLTGACADGIHGSDHFEVLATEHAFTCGNNNSAGGPSAQRGGS